MPLSDCPLCLLMDHAQHKPMHVSLTILKAVAQLDAYCTCGAKKGHGVAHPHPNPRTGCAGFVQRTHAQQGVSV